MDYIGEINGGGVWISFAARGQEAAEPDETGRGYALVYFADARLAVPVGHRIALAIRQGDTRLLQRLRDRMTPQTALAMWERLLLRDIRSQALERIRRSEFEAGHLAEWLGDQPVIEKNVVNCIIRAGLRLEGLPADNFILEEGEGHG